MKKSMEIKNPWKKERSELWFGVLTLGISSNQVICIHLDNSHLKEQENENISVLKGLIHMTFLVM